MRFWVGVFATVAAAAGMSAIVDASTAADPAANYIRASGWVPGEGGQLYVELLTEGDLAALRVRSVGKPDARPNLYLLTTPDTVLRLLADKRVAFLWEPLMQWSGQSLELMRDRAVRLRRDAMAQGRSATGPGTTTESTVREPVRALLQLAAMLDLTGQSAEGVRLLQDRLATMSIKPKTGVRAMEWVAVASALARQDRLDGNKAGALARYAEIEQVMIGSPYAVNASINRAALFAERGDYAEALKAVDDAKARFLATSGGDQVPGSERQFAWIRACALQGLGRHAEAEAAFAPVVGERKWKDEDFLIESDGQLQFRGRMCMKQADQVAKLLREEMLRVPIAPGALLLAQPAYRGRNQDPSLWAGIRADPAFAAAVRERMRVLPESMNAAISGWRTENNQAGAR